MATNGDLARRLLGAAKDDELAARSILPPHSLATSATAPKRRSASTAIRR
jgi:hypothetical protein